MPLWQPTSAIARPAPYDRNAILVTNYLGTSIAAPMAAAVVLSYTVPASRAAFIDALFVFSARTGAWVTPGVAWDYWQFVPASGPTVTLLNIYNQDNTLQLGYFAQQQQFGYMNSGDKFEYVLSDTAAGGIRFIQGGIKGTQFLK